MPAKSKKVKSFFGNSSEGDGGGPSDRWEEVSAPLIHRLVVLATRCQCAVLFGVSKDNGVPTLVLLAGTEKQSHYVRPNEDLEDLIRYYIEFLEGKVEEQEAP